MLMWYPIRLALSIVMTCVLVGVVACSGMPMSSMLKLKGVNFASTDFRELAIGIELPPEVHMGRKVGLDIQVFPGDGEQLTKQVALERSTAMGDHGSLLKIAGSGSVVSVFRIPESELNGLEDFRAQVKKHRAVATAAPQLKLSVRAEGCIADGSTRTLPSNTTAQRMEFPDNGGNGGDSKTRSQSSSNETVPTKRVVYFNSYLKTSETQEFVMLHYRAPLGSVDSSASCN